MSRRCHCLAMPCTCQHLCFAIPCCTAPILFTFLSDRLLKSIHECVIIIQLSNCLVYTSTVADSDGLTGEWVASPTPWPLGSHPGQNASNLEKVQNWRHHWLTDKQNCSALPQEPRFVALCPLMPVRVSARPNWDLAPRPRSVPFQKPESATSTNLL